MPYYFSYDAVIPNYIEEEGFYTKEELHCTLAYSKDDLSDNDLNKLALLNIPKEETAIVTSIKILNNHITLIIDNPNLAVLNKKLLEEFSISEDYDDRIMHVSIKKKLKEIPASLKDFEDKYCGQKIVLHKPKLFIKHPISKEKQMLDLNTISSNKKIKLK